MQQLQSANLIIDEVLSRLTIGEEIEFPVDDALYWIKDAIRDIAPLGWLQKKATILTFENYRADLPEDLYRLRGFHFLPKEVIPKPLPTIDNLNPDEYIRALFDTYGVHYTTLECPKRNDPRVWIQRNCINTTEVDSKLIIIEYEAYPIDERGAVLVPDDSAITNACFYKICYNLSMRGHVFKNKQMADLNFLDQKWQWYCAVARTNSKRPTSEELDRMSKNHNNALGAYRKQWK